MATLQYWKQIFLYHPWWRYVKSLHATLDSRTRFWSAQSDNYLCYNNKFLLLPTKYVIYIDLLNKLIHDQKTVLKSSIRLFLTFMLYIWGSQCLSLTLEVIRFILLHCEASLHVASHFCSCKFSGRVYGNVKHWFILLDQSNYQEELSFAGISSLQPLTSLKQNLRQGFASCSNDCFQTQISPLYVSRPFLYTSYNNLLFFQSTTECMIPSLIFRNNLNHSLVSANVSYLSYWNLVSFKTKKYCIFLSLPIYPSIHPSIIYISIYLERIKGMYGQNIREEKHTGIIGSKRAYANFSRANNINRNKVNLQ